MKNFKINKNKIISILLAGGITLSMTGCANNEKNNYNEIPIIEYKSQPDININNGNKYEVVTENKEKVLNTQTMVYDGGGYLREIRNTDEKCTIVATNGEFALVVFKDGTDGFVNLKSLSNDVTRINGYALVAGNTNLYLDKNFTQVVKTVSANEIVFVCFENDEYIGIGDFANQEIYYMKPDNIVKDFIIVNITNQKMDCYVDYKLVNSYNTRTGKNSTPTHEGTFDIDWKADNWVFPTGEKANYWMAINEFGEGIHDLIGDDEENYGNKSYQLDGSHGCIRVAENASEFVYNNYDVGDIVLVRK